MTHYALIGHPLGHSLSPQIHRALLAAAHLEGDYRLLDIAPEDLANRLPELQTLRGFNVTIPHKQAVLSAMAELEEKAALFGAVNTVAVRGGKFYGYNTDCYGFLRSLSAAGIPLAGRVLILGTGGVARMFAFEAVLAGAAVTLAARTPSKGCALAAEIAEKCGRAVTVTDFNSVTGDWDLSSTAPRWVCSPRWTLARWSRVCWPTRLRYLTPFIIQWKPGCCAWLGKTAPRW